MRHEASGRFAGRRAVVTGASRGIGAAVAEQLAADGAHVAIVARTAEEDPGIVGSLAVTAERLRSYGGRVGVIRADMALESDRAGVVPAAEEALGGPVEILVNNAAAMIFRPMADFPLATRRTIFEVNVHAPLDLAQAVIPAMRTAGEGWIVNVSSSAARMDFRTSPAHGVYGASKAALDQWTRALGVELADSGVRVNTVQPRAGVRSDGSKTRFTLPDHLVEPMSAMVAGVLVLCDGPPELTAGVHVSLDLVSEAVSGAGH